MKKAFQWQVITIAAGTIFAWYTVVVDFVRFFDYHGTIFKIKDCIIPNPVTTPCFWGAIGFLVALVWAIRIKRMLEQTQQVRQQKYLMWFLVGGTIFGWTNVGLLVQRFMASGGKPTIGCSGLIMTNPFTTPCFYGSALFLLSLIVAIMVTRKSKNAAQKAIGNGPSSKQS